jgi:uncharacterized membrane protein
VTISPYVRAAAVGAATGLRTFTGPAATLAAAGSVWTGLVTALAVGEYVADKLPFTPSRLAPPGLVARIVSGGACGGALAARYDGSRLAGAVAGAGAAVGSAWLGYTFRTVLRTDAWLPNVLCALIEDGIAISGARAANAM